jgi:SAM-dependent methyltransferase
MIELPFDAPSLPAEKILAAATNLEDETFAATVFEKGMQQLRRGGSEWLQRLVLLAAHRLGRTDDALPVYEQFLAWVDAQTRGDWHKAFSDTAPADNLAAQSGRLGASEQAFNAEFQRVVAGLAPTRDKPILDVGCAGGLYAIGLARNGFEVIGTDHHAGIIELARRNAKLTGLEAKLKFLVDEVQDSKLAPEYYCARVLCIGVTPCLPNEAAFEALISHLDKVSRPEGSDVAERRVILGQNRWGPSRMSAVVATVAATSGDYAVTLRNLALMETTWWLQPRHLDVIRKHFPGISQIGNSTEKLDGTRVDLLLQ